MLLGLALVLSCQGTTVVRVNRTLTPGVPSGDSGFAASSPSCTISVRKRYVTIRWPSPVAWMNNRGVELAVQGRLREAETMFREVIRDEPGAWAAWNNLGLLYEISGSRDSAFRMYSTACMNDPGNAVYRDNFQTFVDSGREKKK